MMKRGKPVVVKGVSCNDKSVISAHDDDPDWNIRAVFVDEDKKIEPDEGLSGLWPLSNGEVSASSAMLGGRECFYGIDPESLWPCSCGATIVRWKAREVKYAARKVRGKRLIYCSEVDLGDVRELDFRLRVVKEVMQWFQRNRGVAVLVGEPGQRI